MVLISLVIILVLPLEKKDKVVYCCIIELNFLLIYFIATMINLSKSSVSLFYKIEITKEDDNSDYEVTVIKSSFSNIFLIILVVVAYFVELSSGSIITKDSWLSVAKKTFWVYLILLCINSVYLWLYFGVTAYLINQIEDFKIKYIEYYKKSKENSIL
ncbi:hypothetical protein STURON_0079 [Spiroplasma turonicum]|uniref:Transmembrane protein n=2 Tax=Spiroplasma turonicum TaxID=216946 RepID=A0A0K1P4T6_9MOLU|nr:hypothetical protein STURON_0079 [Spiroplasma turonicum]